MTVHARKALRELSIPGALIAGEPPEVRGGGRDDVRLMLATPDGIRHTHFNALPELLRAGDLLVVNTSATLPAAFDGARDSGGDVTVHHGGVLADGTWIVELRSRDGSTGIRDGLAGERIRLATGTLTLISPHNESPGRLWTARADLPLGRQAWLSRHGRPVAYGHMPLRWPLSAYQSVFSRAPGSAEMPSAARPFTDALVVELVTRGVVLAPLLLHAGLSSTEADEPPLTERYAVPSATAALVNATRAAGGRVVAVGTTVARALETAAHPEGRVGAADGWTQLVLSRDRPARVVDALITGWHDPDASHLLLLEAVAGDALVPEAYEAALAEGYRWHEFGDSCLLMGRAV